jgi:anti-sigma-K factor RskA
MMMMIDEEKDSLAAEYVLGTLDRDEREHARSLLSLDPEFAAMVRRWEQRLGELNVLVAPVDPPEGTWERIKARLGETSPRVDEQPVQGERPGEMPAESTIAEAGAPSPAEGVGEAIVNGLRRRVRRWRALAAIASAIAAGLMAVVVAREVRPDLLPEALRPVPVVQVVEKPVEVVRTIEKTVEVPAPRPAEFVAVLQNDAASPAFLLTFNFERRVMTVRTVGAEKQIGKSYELWLVSDKFPAPRSLGLVGREEFATRAAIADFDQVTINNATYAISLEPEGGSPTGVPTGPVLYKGKLLQTTPPGFATPSP